MKALHAAMHTGTTFDAQDGMVAVVFTRRVGRQEMGRSS